MKKINQKNNLGSLLSNLVWGGAFLSTLFLYSHNPLRSLVILALLLLWQVLVKVTLDPFRSSVLWSLLVLPFNITFSLESLASPYVGGVFVNYLVPTVSILDVGMLLIFCSSLTSFKEIVTKSPFWFKALSIYGLLHILLHPTPLSLLWVARLILYAISISRSAELFKKGETLASALRVSLVSVLIQLLIGIAQFSMGKSLGLTFLGEPIIMINTISSSFIELSQGVFLRAYGTFPHPNVLAGYLLLTSILMGYLIVSNRQRHLAIIVLGASSLLLILTFSRLHLLLLLVSLLTWFLLPIVRKAHLSIFPILTERFGNLFSSSDYSLRDRVELMKRGFDIAKENIFTGLGAGEFVRGLESGIPKTVSGISLLQPVHNIFMLLFAEHGLIQGAILSLLMLYSFVRKIVMRRGALRVLSVLLIISVLLIGTFDHYLVTLPQGLAMLLLVVFF